MILGDPVQQVLAPALFNPLFAQHGVDAVLVPAHVRAADLTAFVRGVLPAANLGGLWLTIPHKTPVFRMLDRCDRLGTIAQSVNAVRRAPDGALEGGLFDGLGFVNAVASWGIELRGASVMLVGVGGAGAAIAASLAQRGVAQLTLHDVDRLACEAMADRLSTEFPLQVSVAPRADPEGHALVINATPLGLRSTDPLPFDPARMSPGACVVDILMKDAPTPLLRACTLAGVKAWPGHEMMIQQAPQYLGFFGLDTLAAEVQKDLSAIRRTVTPDIFLRAGF